MRVERNINTVDVNAADVTTVDVAPVVQPVATVPVANVGHARVVEEPVVVPVERHAETVRVASSTTISPAAITGTLFAIALLVFGGVTMARAGFDGALEEPIVSVGGFTATAVLGLFAAASGLVLLAASLARANGAILLFSIIIGIVAVIAAIEPTMGNGALAIERGFAVLMAIGAGIVILSAVLAPTVHRTASHVERV